VTQVVTNRRNVAGISRAVWNPATDPSGASSTTQNDIMWRGRDTTDASTLDVRSSGFMVSSSKTLPSAVTKKEPNQKMKRCFSLLGAVITSLALGATAHADLITNLQVYDGTSLSPIVTVYYSNADGTGTNSALTYADPQVNGGTGAPLYDCIDLWHDNFLGSTYTITPVSTIAYATSTFSDVDNRLAWLIDQPQSTVDERAATQLALWYTIDNIVTKSFRGFSYSGGDATLRNDYENLISFAGYNPDVHYDAQLWAATHDSQNQLYQDLISSVPEPNSGLLAIVGLAAGLGYHASRRNRRSAEAP
jgi:hypothetical protein